MTSEKTASKGFSLWIWVIAAFLILISAWTTLIVVAQKNQPEIIEVEKN